MQQWAGLGWGSLAVRGELLASRSSQDCRLFFLIPHVGMFPGAPSFKAGGPALNLAPRRQSQAVGLEEMGLSSPLLPFPGTGTCADPLAVSEQGDRKLQVVF